MSDIERRASIQAMALPPGVNVTSAPRCGDTDRQRASDRISEAYARGFIDKEEAEARQEAIGQVTLAAHLEELTRDIPAITRFRGASLPAREKSRAELAIGLWQSRQPWTGLSALAAGLMAGIAPAAAVNIPLVAALTIPPGVVFAIFGLWSALAWLMDVAS